MRKKVIVFTDIHGHFHPFMKMLNDYGITADFIPEDIHLIIAGDLVDKGEHSKEVIDVVAQWFQKFPDRFSALVGNHESMVINMLASKRMHKPHYIVADNETIRKIQVLIEDGHLLNAIGVSCDDGDFLITHAGLTHGAWTKIGSPMKLGNAVSALNSIDFFDKRTVLHDVGEIMGVDRNPSAGPLWASATEVYMSWMNQESVRVNAPFSQIHGHSSAYNWAYDSMREVALQPRVHVAKKKRHTIGVFASAKFMGIDPDHQRSVSRSWAPLVFDNARVISSSGRNEAERDPSSIFAPFNQMTRRR